MQKYQHFLWNSVVGKTMEKKMQSGSRGCALLHRKVHNPEDLKRSQAGDLRSNKFPLDIQSTGFYFLTTQSTQHQYWFTILMCVSVCLYELLTARSIWYFCRQGLWDRARSGDSARQKPHYSTQQQCDLKHVFKSI